MSDSNNTPTNDTPTLPPRPHDGHKGTFGRLTIFAGSRGMAGAAVLSGRAALRGGAGLVTVASPESIADNVAAQEPCFMTERLPVDSDGELALLPPEHLHETLGGQNAVAIGPGLGRSKGAAACVERVVANSQVPVVLDADALNIAADIELLSREQNSAFSSSNDLVITPHPGEFSRLTGLSVAKIEADRTGHAKNFASAHDVTVVLKGHRTVVTDGRQTYINETGNSGMATGGSGDVLTGILAAQIAQGMKTFDAAVLAVHVHGLAGDIAAAVRSERGLIATDLIDFLGKAWLKLESRPADE